MTGLNVEWVLAELDQFIRLTDGHFKGDPYEEGVWWSVDGDPDAIKQQLPIVERVFDQLSPEWRRDDFTYDATDQEERTWGKHRDLAIHVRVLLAREQEIRDNLGDGAPAISAGQLHPWIWSGAASLWQSGHYRSAVEDAAKKLNAETQNKLGRRDVSETKLFQEAFSLDAPAVGKPRLRRTKADGSDTYKSMQRGAMALADGIYAGIRNPFNHEDPKDIDEQIGLEYLAALSVLARWVDEASLEVA